MNIKTSNQKNKIKEQIEQKLLDHFAPLHLEVIDESHGHNVPNGAQTHFRVVLVTPVFVGLNRVQRHKKVYTVLHEELSNLIKALSVLAFDPSEWASKQNNLPASPPCLGGGHNNKPKESGTSID